MFNLIEMKLFFTISFVLASPSFGFITSKFRSFAPSLFAIRAYSENTGDNVFCPISNSQVLKDSIRQSACSAAIISSILLGTVKLSRAEDENALTYITTESGLKYADIKVGDGAVPLPGDLVRVHYTGWLDGFDSPKKFDSSYDRRSPLSFKVGARQVISGWDEGILTNLKVGGKRNLIIPPELGYGSRGAGGVIPPNATLYFTVELVGIGAKPNR